MAAFGSVPGEIRTPDRRLRRALLYPAELLRHFTETFMYCMYLNPLNKTFIIIVGFQRKVNYFRINMYSFFFSYIAGLLPYVKTTGNHMELHFYSFPLKNFSPRKKVRFHKKQPNPLKGFGRFGSVPGEIRTPDRRLRRALLYPAELLRHFMI